MLMRWRTIRDNRGQALVEMALLLPVLLLILCGIIEFGRVFHAYLEVTYAAREGARYAVVGYTDSQTAAHIAAVANTLNADALTVTISPTEDERHPGDEVTVQVGYNVEILTPVISSILPNPFPVTGKVVMRVE